MERLIGRERELEQLQKYTQSGKEEFVALFGRRRVGKTFLVRKFFQDKFDFYVTGLIGGTKSDEMAAFNESLVNYGFEGDAAKDWFQAFNNLASLLKKKSDGNQRLVVFIDELPCFDTPRSGFVKALDYFWNSKGSWMSNLLFVVCGSATSWMIRNIIDNKGGLHNRITHEMHLQPFSLNLVEQYLRSKGALWDRLSIAQLYMALGGIPYYLSLLDYELSVAENIDALFFAKNAELKKEYKRLFKSLYKNPEGYMSVITLLARKKEGMTRTEISKKLKIEGSQLTAMLEDLVNCDFIEAFNNGNKKNDCIYRLMDFYTLFYNHFCTRRTTDIRFWRNHLGQPLLNTWHGLAFERLCMAHMEEIKYDLHLDTIYTEYYSWRSKSSKPGAQIDLVIERSDNVFTICEIKYSQGNYTLDHEEYEKIVRRRDAFATERKLKSVPQVVLITTCGLTPHHYSDIQKRPVLLDALFQNCRL